MFPQWKGKRARLLDAWFERVAATDDHELKMDQSNPAFVSPYLTAAEAAAYIRSTVQAIYSLVKRRKLFPMPGRPGRLLFTREALDRYLSGRYRR